MHPSPTGTPQAWSPAAAIAYSFGPASNPASKSHAPHTNIFQTHLDGTKAEPIAILELPWLQ